MTPEIQTGVTEEEYAKAQSKYVVIPPGPSGKLQEGDSIDLGIEILKCESKTPGVSIVVTAVVTEEGENNLKEAEMFLGIAKDAMPLTKPIIQALGIEEKVIKFVDGKMRIDTDGFNGATGKGHFVAEMSNKGNMRTVLRSILAEGAEVEDIGIS